MEFRLEAGDKELVHVDVLAIKLGTADLRRHDESLDTRLHALTHPPR